MRSEPAPERLVWTAELVERFWNGVARTRLVELSFSRVAGAQLLPLLRPYLRPDGRHLDFGAGDGSLTQLLAREGFAVAALEPAAARRAELEARLAGAANFLGALAPDAADDSFDVVLMVEVIEHLLDADLDPALRLIGRLLRPGGTLIVTTPNNEDLDLGMAVCPVTGLMFHRWQHMRSFTRDSLAALLVRHGFTPVVHHEFDAAQDLAAPLFRRGERWWQIVTAIERAARRHQVARRLRRGRTVHIGAGSTLVVIATCGAAAG